MALDPRLLDLLVCPACHGRLTELGAGEALECGGCRRRYPVRDGIPVMLVDEAETPDPA